MGCADNHVMSGNLIFSWPRLVSASRPFSLLTLLFCVLVFVLALFAQPQTSWSVAEANQDPVVVIRDSQTATGRQAAVSGLRDGKDDKKSTMTVNVQSLEDVMKVMTSSIPNRLEANVQPVTTAEAEKYHLRSNQGVIIIWLDPKGPLGRAGLSTSDIIVQIDNQPVEGVEDFVRMVDALGTLQASTFSVLDRRTGQLRNVKIVLGVQNRAHEAQAGFLTRQLDAAIAGVKWTARSVEQNVSYAVDKGKGALSTAVRELKRWVGLEEAPVASARKSEQAPATPHRPPAREPGGPG